MGTVHRHAAASRQVRATLKRKVDLQHQRNLRRAARGADHGLGGRGHGRHDHRRKRLRKRLRSCPVPRVRLRPRPCRTTLSSRHGVAGGGGSADGKRTGVALARALHGAGDGMGARATKSGAKKTQRLPNVVTTA